MKYIIRNYFSIVIIISIITTGLNAQTYVSGGIYSNTTWTLANSPYVVVDTVVVFPSVTLTIQPGVTVKFADNKRLEIRNATILAEGTISDSIKFTSNSTSPTLGLWSEIFLNGVSQSSKFNYCSFSYAKNALKIINSADTVMINHSNFFFNNYGIYFFNSGAKVFINYSNYKNNINGIYCDFWNGFINIDNCNISKNQNGVCIGEYSKITNSIIDSNNVFGVYHFAYNDSIFNCQIKYNGIGIYEYATYNDPSIVSENVIENNNIGIRLEGWRNSTIMCNKICNNSSYDLDYAVTLGNDAFITNNYWCSNDSATIASHIHDGYDNINLNIAHFVPFDTLQCYLATTAPESAFKPDLFYIFPNPTSNNLTVTMPDNFINMSIKIINLLGELEYSTIRTSQKTNIDVSTLTSGVHIIQITLDNKVISKMFIKQ